MEPRTSRNKNGLTVGLGILQAFIGLGAVVGGGALILAPDGSILGLPLEALENSPFSTYLIPGVVLLAVNGIGSLVGSATSFTRRDSAGGIAVALGLFLVAWIVLQVYFLATIHWAHALYFALGVLEAGMGWRLCRTRSGRRNSAA